MFEEIPYHEYYGVGFDFSRIKHSKLTIYSITALISN
jgi:hypothetical protein